MCLYSHAVMQTVTHKHHLIFQSTLSSETIKAHNPAYAGLRATAQFVDGAERLCDFTV